MLQIIMLTAAIMLVVSTYGFFKLPNAGSQGGPLDSEFQELRAMMQKQGDAFTDLQKKMSELTDEVSHAALTRIKWSCDAPFTVHVRCRFRALRVWVRSPCKCD